MQQQQYSQNYNKYSSTNKRMKKSVEDNQLLNGLIYQLIPYADYAVMQLMKYTTNNCRNISMTTAEYNTNTNTTTTPSTSPPNRGLLEDDTNYKSFSNMYTTTITAPTISAPTISNSSDYKTPPPPPRKNFTNFNTPTSSPSKPPRPTNPINF